MYNVSLSVRHPINNMAFQAATLAVFQEILNTPQILEDHVPEKKKFLWGQGNTESQGIGNQPTDQEAAFAVLLERHGFAFAPSGTTPTTDGLYYRYQLNGSQQSIDFLLMGLHEGRTEEQPVDLKHTNSTHFYLNDGWFETNVVYIVSWKCSIKSVRGLLVPSTRRRAFLALGQHIYTAEENAIMQEVLDIKKSFNEKYKKTGSLRVYFRFANQYSCSRFTPEFTTERYNEVKEYIQAKQTPPPLLAEEAPRSPPVQPAP